MLQNTTRVRKIGNAVCCSPAFLNLAPRSIPRMLCASRQMDYCISLKIHSIPEFGTRRIPRILYASRQMDYRIPLKIHSIPEFGTANVHPVYCTLRARWITVYPLRYTVFLNLAPREGLEPPTSGFGDQYSTN